MKNLKEIQNNLNKAQLLNALIQKNIKGGIGCPPPIFNKRSAIGDPPPFGGKRSSMVGDPPPFGVFE